MVKILQDKAKETRVITEDKIKEVVREIIAKSKDVREKPQKIVKGLKEKAARSDEAKIEEILKKLDIPTKEDLNGINTRLDALINKLEKAGDNDEHIQ